MPTEVGDFFAGLDGDWPIALALVLLAAILLFAASWIRRLRRRIAASDERLAGEAERRGAAEDRTRWVSDHDVFTELPRLHHFVERVNAILARPGTNASDKQVVALKLADLDDTIRALGHDAGLEMARGFAKRLTSLGLDEYGLSGRDLFLAFGDEKQIEAELRSKLTSADDMLPTSTPHWPRVYAGSAACAGLDAREAVRRAESALGRAIDANLPWVDWDQSFELDASDLRLVQLFRESHAEGLTAVFQPQVDLRTGEMVGAEALARWTAPGIGEVDAARFVQLLEDAGAIRSLTRRMIDEAARVAALLRARGKPCAISVNVAASDLLTGDIRESIFRAMRTHGARAEDLRLELTETSLAESAESLRWVLSRLRDCGLSISIDDFGTGFSSLSYLNDFPVDEVKIDRTFVSGLPGKQRNRSIVRATIAMAHELGLAVVAEGVDDDAAMQILREDGCDRAQGFLISRPLAERELIEFVVDNRRRTMRARTGG